MASIRQTPSAVALANGTTIQPPRAIAVDLGGVVFLSMNGADTPARIAQRLGLSAGRVSETLWLESDVDAANVGKLTAAEYANRAADRLGVGPEAILAAIERVFAGQLNSRLVAFLRTVKPGIRVAALTNNWSFLDQLLERHGVSDLFDVVVNSAETGCCKPDVRAFEILLERLQCSAQDVLYVDDEPANLAAAESLGFQVMHFKAPFETLNALQNLVYPPAA